VPDTELPERGRGPGAVHQVGNWSEVPFHVRLDDFIDVVDIHGVANLTSDELHVV
jgi:hypothetical protein